MQSVRHDGRETAYRRTDFGSEKSPVLYVHGSGGTHEIWVHQYGRRENNRPAVALDLSGHGESDDINTEPGYETLDAYADDVLAVANEVDAGVFVGNSLGGAVLLHLAIERGIQPDALVLCGTGAKLSVTEELIDLLADDFDSVIEFLHGSDVLFHDASDEAIAASKAGMRECGLRVTRRDLLSCNTFDVRDRLDQIQVPSLAITGEHDGLTPVFFHEFLSDNIPTCTQVTIEDAAHLSMLEQEEQWNDAVDSFLG
jgi:3-oxoadipate enol-lactonase